MTCFHTGTYYSVLTMLHRRYASSIYIFFPPPLSLPFPSPVLSPCETMLSSERVSAVHRWTDTATCIGVCPDHLSCLFEDPSPNLRVRVQKGLPFCFLLLPLPSVSSSLQTSKLCNAQL